jgi:hypothetical protein
MICWRCHSNSINTGSRLPICSDVKTRKRRNVVGIDMIRNKCIDFKITHKHYIRNLQLKFEIGQNNLWEWWPFLRCLPKHIKISKCYNFNENWYLEDFWPEEYDSDKCDLKIAAIAAIMVAILAAIFNMVAKTHQKFRSPPMLQLQRKLIFRGF